jgi:hypothetical protein
VPNPDLPDSYNTVIRMAEKRALVAAVRMVTGSSSLFEEEMPDDGETDPEPARQAPKQDQSQRPPQGSKPPTNEADPDQPRLAERATVNAIRTAMADLGKDELTWVHWAAPGKRMAEELTVSEATKLAKALADEAESKKAFEAWAAANLPGGNPDLATLNQAMPSLASLPQEAKKMAWHSVQQYAASQNWTLDMDTKRFKFLEERTGAA